MSALPVFHLSVDQYHAMVDNGILTPDDRVELLDGVIVQKVTIRPPHRISTHATRQALERLIPRGWYVDDQAPITLAASEPGPDVAVIRGNTRDYFNRHPGAADAGIVIEASDSRIERDRGIKKRIYAAGGVCCYWIIDLNRRRLEVYSEPHGHDYQRCEFFEPHERVEVSLDNRTVGSVLVSDLLP